MFLNIMPGDRRAQRGAHKKSSAGIPDAALASHIWRGGVASTIRKLFEFLQFLFRLRSEIRVGVILDDIPVG